MKVICLCMVIVGWLGFTNVGAAEESLNNVLDKRFTIYGGLQVYQADGEFRSTKEGDPDITIDLDDLGLDDNLISPIVGGIINFWGRRMTLRLDYFGYHDDANATADFEFDFDGITFPIGARLDSNLDLDLYVVNLSYNFYRSDRARFGLGIGVHAADIDIGVSGTVKVGDKEIDLGSGGAELLAPLPNLYVNGAYAFTDKFLLRYGGGGFSLKYGDWDGSLFFANAFFEYWPFKYLGLGAGYRYLSADVTYDGSSREEKYDFVLPGPLFYVTAGF